MAELTYGQLLDAQPALQALMEERLPAKSALKLRRLVRTVRERLEDLEAERMALLKTHAMLDEQGQLQTDEAGQCRFPCAEARRRFMDAFADLAQTPADVGPGLAGADLGGAAVTAAQLLALGELVTDTEE